MERGTGKLDGTRLRLEPKADLWVPGTIDLCQGGESHTIPVSPEDPHISTRHLTCLTLSQPTVWFALAKDLDGQLPIVPWADLIGDGCNMQWVRTVFKAGNVAPKPISRKQQLFVRSGLYDPISITASSTPCLRGYSNSSRFSFRLLFPCYSSDVQRFRAQSTA